MLEQKRRSIHSKAGEQLFTSFNALGEDPRIDSRIVECFNFDIEHLEKERTILHIATKHFVTF